MKNQYQQFLVCTFASLATIAVWWFTPTTNKVAKLPEQAQINNRSESTSATTFGPSSYIGEITLFAGDYAPRDFAFCNGQSLLTADYPALQAILGYTYGGSGATFNLPDFRGRIAVQHGTGTQLTPIALGEMVGNDTLKITETATIAGAGRPTTINVLKAPTDNHYISKSPYLGMNYIIRISNGTFPSGS